MPTTWTDLSVILKEVSTYIRYSNPGFLGRNFRYRDSEEFYGLKYFIQRYISAATLILELGFIHRSMEQLSNKKIECVVIDTMGIDARIKSILSDYHGRYHTIGSSIE